jgi:hypothetical protein
MNLMNTSKQIRSTMKWLQTDVNEKREALQIAGRLRVSWQCLPKASSPARELLLLFVLLERRNWIGIIVDRRIYTLKGSNVLVQ